MQVVYFEGGTTKSGKQYPSQVFLIMPLWKELWLVGKAWILDKNLIDVL